VLYDINKSGAYVDDNLDLRNTKKVQCINYKTCARGQRTFIALDHKSEVISSRTQLTSDSPHVDVQVGNVAKIQDQVPGMLSMADSEDSFSLTSRANKCKESCVEYLGC
jgi:hypothetical protein